MPLESGALLPVSEGVDLDHKKSTNEFMYFLISLCKRQEIPGAIVCHNGLSSILNDPPCMKTII
jgi:hypothetical protein